MSLTYTVKLFARHVQLTNSLESQATTQVANVTNDDMRQPPRSTTAMGKYSKHEATRPSSVSTRHS